MTARNRALRLADNAQVHRGEKVELCTGAVLLVPGEKPRVVLTPRYQAKDGDLEQLVRDALHHGLHDVAREVRHHLNLAENGNGSTAAQHAPDSGGG